MGRFTARFAQGLPEDVRATAFCGPASFRDPEADDIWHPGLMRNGFFALARNQAPKLILSFFSGIRRFLLKRFGCFIFIGKQHAGILGIAPVTVCKPKGDSVETGYCHPIDRDAMDWLLIDDMGSEPEGYLISQSVILFMYLRTLVHCFRVFFFSRENDRWIDWTAGFLLTIRWVLGMVWVNKWMLSLRIRSILEEMRPEKVFCVHEMHPHSRIAWIEAVRFNITTVTIQHASIVRTKLWYFPVPEELAAGMAVPDIMAVFSDEVRGLFEQFFPGGVSYPLTCGPRFAKWKEIGPEKVPRFAVQGPILFAGSLPWWDNVVVLQGVIRLLAEGSPRRPILVRLHPASDIPTKWKKRLDNLAMSNKIAISSGPLEDDLGRCAVVAGMNTTVLEEAALLGKGVMVLEDRDYLSFATRLGTHVPLERFSWETVEQVVLEAETRKKEMVQEGKDLLGIDYPVFRVCPDTDGIER